MSTEFPVVFALYADVTQLDLTATFEVFARLPGARCSLAMVFDEVLRLGGIEQCGLLCVPGGIGVRWPR